MELWILGLFAILLVIGALGVWFVRGRKRQNAQTQTLAEESAALRAELDASQSQMRSLVDFARQFNEEMSFSESISFTLETLWRLPEIDSVAIVLGEHELGPFHYAGIRGIADPFAVVGKECALPLWGTLAHAIVHRPQAGETDCLAIHDILAEGKPLPAEFSWLPAQGSLLVIPLRGRGTTLGAVILYSKHTQAFQDANRERFLYALVSHVSRSLHEARTYEQSLRWVGQLVSLQLLTRTLTGIDSVESILRVLREEATDMFGTVAVHLFLQATEMAIPGQSRLGLHSGPHISEREERFVRSPALQQLLAWVTEAEQPLFVDPQVAFGSPSDLYYQESGHGVLVTIFGTAETAAGVLLLVAPEEARPFDENDLIVIRTIANAASVTIGSRRFGMMAQPTPV